MILKNYLGKCCGKIIWYIVYNLIMPNMQQNVKDFNKASEQAGLGKAF